MPSRPARLQHQHHRVSAVLVVHDGARWLAEVLAAIAAQTRPVQRLVAVDVGSADGSDELLEAALGADRVVRVGRDCGFGTAVAAGLAHLDALAATAPDRASPRRRSGDDETPPERVHWVWLIHDDSAPEPDALAALVEAASASPSVGMLGPKVRDWDDPRLLVEVGLTTDRAGRRETGLERREYDQGQHDSPRDVLAVGTAGMLVRRDVWDSVGGLDRALPMLRDDIDLGWRVNAAGYRVVVVPEACLRHARAVWTGKRALSATHGRVSAVDRRHSLLVVLANLRPGSMPGALPRLIAGALLRTIAFLLTRQLSAARDEIAAVGWVLAHSGELRRMRRSRRRTRTADPAALRGLFVGRTARLRGYLDAFADWATGGGDEAAPSLGDDPEADPGDLPPARGRGIRLVRAHPGTALVLVLALLALVAARDLIEAGRLIGGELLPVPGGARELWASYASSWHPVGAGTDAALSPSVALVAAAGTVMRGRASLAVAVLLAGAVPLAGLSAYASVRRVTANVPLRVWAAATYALLPVVTGAVAGGRLDAVVAAIAVPPLVAGGHTLLTTDPQHAGWRLPFGYGLGLAAAAAFAPPIWLLAAVGLLGTAVIRTLAARSTGRGEGVRRLLAVVLALGTAMLALLPWSWRLAASPGQLVAGLPSVRGEPLGPVPTGLDLLLGRPGGPAVPAVWVTVGLVLAAAAGLVRRRRQAVALGGWALALGGTLAAVLVTRGVGSLPRSYPAAALALAGCGLVLAAVVAADGALERLGRYDFGWRQGVAAVVAVVAVVTPLAAAGSWVRRGADDPLHRQKQVALPSIVLAEADRTPGMRVLWLDTSADGQVRYALTGARGLALPDAGLDGPDSAGPILDSVVADLTSARGTNAAESLAAFHVRYVAVANPVPPVIAAGLDVQAGLARVSFVAPVQLWQTLTPSGRLTVLQPTLARIAVAGQVAGRDQLRQNPPTVLPSRRESARAQLLPGPSGRLLVLAEGKDADWVATLDGKALARSTAYGWAQAFELPAGAGRIEVRHDTSTRRSALAVQGLVLLVVVVLAAPSIRRRDDGPDEQTATSERPAHEAQPLVEPVAVAPSNVRRI